MPVNNNINKIKNYISGGEEKIVLVNIVNEKVSLFYFRAGKQVSKAKF